MKVNPHGYPSFLKTYVGEVRYWERIQIPSCFVKAHKNKLVERTWVLKTEDGTSWDMEIKRQDAEYFFLRAEWENLAKHHTLRFGDQIAFYLVGNSEFEVMLYNQTTCCRILLPKHEHTDNGSSEDLEIEDSRKSKKHKKSIAGKCETPKNAKRLGYKAVELKSENVEEESSDSESETEEKGVPIRRYNNNVYLDPKKPYFEMVVKKSHDIYMSVPMEFARPTRMIGEKIIKLKMNGDEIRKAEVIEVFSTNKRVRLVKGWTSFKKANRIRTGDKCSFTLVNPGSSEILCLSVKKLR